MTVMGMLVPGRRLAILVMSVCTAIVGGCSDRVLDVGMANYVFSGPRQDQPTPIRSMTGQETSYPNLATVPPRPTGLTTQAQRDAQMKALEDHRARNRLAADALEEKAQGLPAPLPQPMEVPPPPRIREGG